MEYKRDFYVCFREAKGNYWWKIFTGKKRSHIFLITACEINSCVKIECSNGGMGVYAYSRSADDMARHELSDGCEVIQYLVEEKDMVTPYPKLLRNCVSVAKDLLGIRAWWIITPDQLFKELLRR
jgi:hypothetical protein